MKNMLIAFLVFCFTSPLFAAEVINSGATNPVAPYGDYINFGTKIGSAGYGFRTNSGTIEFKNLAGSWGILGGGSGDVVGPSSSVDSEIAIYNATTGKLLKRFAGTGIVKATSGVIGTATAGTDYVVPTGSGSGLTGITASQTGAIAQTNGTGTGITLAGTSIFPSGVWSSTGNVGIGTSTVTEKLTLGDGVTSGGVVARLNAPAADWAGTGLSKAGTEKWFIGMGDTATYGDKLLFRRGSSTNDMNIDAAGQVSIGGTIKIGAALTPDATHLLAIGNTTASTFIQIGQGASNSYEMGWTYNATPANAYGQIVTFGYANDLRINSKNLILQDATAGNVGIGMSTPSAKVHSVSTTEQLRLGYDASNYWSSTVGATGGLTLAGVGTGGALGLTPASGSNLNVNLAGAGDFAVNTNQLYVDTSTGSVGIGTTVSIEKLDVRGAINWNGASTGYASAVSMGQLDFFNAARVLSFGADGSTYGEIDFYQATANNGASRTAMVINNQGNVGIGTNAPIYKLSVNGIAGIYESYTDASNYSALKLGADSAGYKFTADQIGTGIANRPFVFLQTSGATGTGWDLQTGTGTSKVKWDVNGKQYDGVIGDSSASPGNATLNTVSGKSAIAAGQTAMTLTNSNIASTSMIFICPLDVDATALSFKHSVATGVGTITVNAAATADWKFIWKVIN